MAENHAVVRVYDPNAEAKAAHKDFERSRTARNRLSIVGKDYVNDKLIERARDADDWLCSDDAHWLFSFLSVCAALGLEPHYIRNKLRY